MITHTCRIVTVMYRVQILHFADGKWKPTVEELLVENLYHEDLGKRCTVETEEGRSEGSLIAVEC